VWRGATELASTHTQRQRAQNHVPALPPRTNKKKKREKKKQIFSFFFRFFSVLFLGKKLTGLSQAGDGNKSNQSEHL
jgi:hypothetical protein